MCNFCHIVYPEGLKQKFAFIFTLMFLGRSVLFSRHHFWLCYISSSGALDNICISMKKSVWQRLAAWWNSSTGVMDCFCLSGSTARGEEELVLSIKLEHNSAAAVL